MPYKNDENLKDIFKQIAPGTELREGLENVLAAKTGGIIVFGYDGKVSKMCDGGFFIDQEFMAAKLYELAKMDGALILTEDASRILYANIHLNPDSTIATDETGIRHRTAERVAKQTGYLVISISQRRDRITLYKDSTKYVLPETSQLVNKANQAMLTVEKYKKEFEAALEMLNSLELDDLVSLNDVCTAIQSGELLLKMGDVVERYVLELGIEGKLLKSHLDQLIGSAASDLNNLFRDYTVVESVGTLPEAYYLELTNISDQLGYYSEVDILDAPVFPRGYRILSKIKRLPDYVINNVINHFENFQSILNADMDEMDEVEGVGVVRARNITEGLKRLREVYSLENKGGKNV